MFGWAEPHIVVVYRKCGNTWLCTREREREREREKEREREREKEREKEICRYQDF